MVNRIQMGCLPIHISSTCRLTIIIHIIINTICILDMLSLPQQRLRRMQVHLRSNNRHQQDLGEVQHRRLHKKAARQSRSLIQRQATSPTSRCNSRCIPMRCTIINICSTMRPICILTCHRSTIPTRCSSHTSICTTICSPITTTLASCNSIGRQCRRKRGCFTRRAHRGIQQ